MTAPRSPSIPWSESDVLRLCLTTAVGLVVISLTWYGVSGSADTGRQALWLNVGVAGVVISALGNCIWLLRGRRAVGERRADLISLEVPEVVIEPVADRASGHAETLTIPLGIVRAEGMSRVHRPDCPLVVGKPVLPASLGDGDACGVCAP